MTATGEASQFAGLKIDASPNDTYRMSSRELWVGSRAARVGPALLAALAHSRGAWQAFDDLSVSVLQECVFLTELCGH